MSKRDYTPEEIMTVVEAIVAQQRERGYKPGWVIQETNRRVEKAQRQSGSFYLCGMERNGDLAWQAYYIAIGEQSPADLLKQLRSNWEVHQSYF